MGAAEMISLDEVRARKPWESLRHQLHARFDQWRDRLEAQGPASEPPWAAVTETRWALRHARTGSLPEPRVAHTPQAAYPRQQRPCPQGERLCTARAPVPRLVETRGGPVQLERPYGSGRPCHGGVAPLDEVLGLTAGRLQLDVQKAVAPRGTDVP
jgi:hypothetical protein